MARDATRRRVLAIGAVTLSLAAAGCKGLAALGTPPKAAPDVAVVGDAIMVEARLIAHYGAVLAAVPTLAGPLQPLLTQHHDHLARLRARLIIPPGSRATDPASPGASPATSPSPFTVPATPAAALGYLRDAENAAAAAQLGHLTAAPPSLAQLLASISASEATHAMILGGRGRRR
jgi:hypothetical protein